MAGHVARAHINLHAVLRNLEDLCTLDPVARRLVDDLRLRVIFRVPGVRQGQFTFHDGTCVAGPSAVEVPEIRLGFLSASHFNAVMGGAAPPLPFTGIRHTGLLRRRFTALTARLGEVLRPQDAAAGLGAAPAGPPPDGSPAAASDEAWRLQTVLTAYTLFFAIAEVAAHDPMGRVLAARMPDGPLAVGVEGGPTVGLVADRGSLRAFKGPVAGARAWMTFDSLETARELFDGRVLLRTAIGLGQVEVRGFVPMLSVLEALMPLAVRALETGARP